MKVTNAIRESFEIMKLLFNNLYGTQTPDWSNMHIQDKTVHGWLKPYLITTETITNGRWMFWLDTMLTHDKYQNPIPQLEFCSSQSREYSKGAKMLEKLFKYNSSRTGCSMRESLIKFIDWFLYGVGCKEVLKLDIKDEVNKYWYENFDISKLLRFPCDYFGNMATRYYSNKHNGFFPTPNQIVDMMTRMAMNDNKDECRYKRTIDPCMGTGRMLLYASNYSLNLYGQDIDRFLCKVTLANCFLYVPWVICKNEKYTTFLK